ncbi:MAG TPA: HAMP domain-containing sensor histidine kinase [Thiopseudomonas sp.]|nr:HAMP domain-containing sensor histidine kinase [Thiopseudomonas sp.]
MRSLFWRVFGAFWLALLLMGGLTYLLVRIFSQDEWILNQHPGLKDFAANWLERYESGDTRSAAEYLQQHRQNYRIETQILDASGIPLELGPTPRAMSPITRRGMHRSTWRTITQEVAGNKQQDYLFVYRIARSELSHVGLRPWGALLIAFLVLTLMSFLLTLSITRPLNRLRHAVHDLGQTSFQKDSLKRLAKRGDELGLLAADFNRMGQRLQGLIESQRQLLRDVSHELRSPLARLQIALALAERGSSTEQAELWPRLHLECERLDGLINEILTLARLDQEQTEKQSININQLLIKLKEDAELLAPEQRLNIRQTKNINYQGWPSLLHRALDNLLRNALRFNPAGQPIEITVEQTTDTVLIQIRDQGPGVDEEYLSQLGNSFFRVPGQQQQGYGLGLAIAKRAVEQHGGQLQFSNHSAGGFIASVILPKN